MQLLLLSLDCEAEFKSVKEKSNDYLVHLNGFREAYGFPHYALDPRAQCEVFSFQLLRPSLADSMLVRSQVAVIRTPAVGVKAANAQRCEQGFEFQQRSVLPATKNVR